jgi:hypothetical protein
MKSKQVHKGKSSTKIGLFVQMDQTLLTNIRDLVLSARRQVAQVVNAGLTLLYRETGSRIRQNILEKKGGLRQGNCRRAGATIGRRVRKGFR